MFSSWSYQISISLENFVHLFFNYIGYIFCIIIKNFICIRDGHLSFFNVVDNK